MTGSNTVKRAAGMFGQTVRLLLPSGERYVYKAFLKPLNYKNKVFIENNMLPAGEYGKDCMLYIGPNSRGGEKLCHRAMIEYGGARYIVNAASRFYFKDRVYYTWAVLARVSNEEI